jgi:HlyD family secretion protein
MRRVDQPRPALRSSARWLALALTSALHLGCDADGPVDLVGTVERTQLELVAPISEVIVEIRVERGEAVAAGRRIVALDATLATAELRRAEADLARSRTADRIAAQELERARRLRRSSVASQQAFDQADLEREAATAALLEAEAAVDAAKKRLADLDLRAPAASVVDQLPYEVGERVPTGAVLAVLLRDEQPWVRVWLPEPYLARVRPGLETEVSVDGWAAPLRGRVLDVAREPTFTPHYALTERERAHLAYETRVVLVEPPEGLRPGVPATVRLPFARSEAVTGVASSGNAEPRAGDAGDAP